MLTARRVPMDDDIARRLWAGEWAELEGRYGDLGTPAELPADGVIASFVGYVGDDPVGTVVVRMVEYDGHPPAAEIKRMYVIPSHRGNGFSRALMSVAEAAAREAGASRIILETGERQPEALGLYASLGYDVIPNYGPWACAEDSICMAKDLAPAADLLD